MATSPPPGDSRSPAAPDGPQSPGSAGGPQSPGAGPQSPGAGGPQSPPPAGGNGGHGGGEGNGPAIAALALGLLGVIGAFLTVGVLGLLFGVPAIILGVQGRRRVASGRTDQHRGLATGGLVSGIIATILGLLFILLVVAGISFLSNNADVENELDRLQDEIEQQQGR